MVMGFKCLGHFASLLAIGMAKIIIQWNLGTIVKSPSFPSFRASFLIPNYQKFPSFAYLLAFRPQSLFLPHTAWQCSPDIFSLVTEIRGSGRDIYCAFWPFSWVITKKINLKAFNPVYDVKDHSILHCNAYTPIPVIWRKSGRKHRCKANLGKVQLIRKYQRRFFLYVCSLE